MPNKSSRLSILEQSLAKKEQVLNQKIGNHFETVKQANGQPLNDKRNGQATLNKWDKQNQSISNQLKEIEKTQNAIEKEKAKIANVEAIQDDLPPIIKELLADGKITQWRKYPNRFFVVGVEKARLVFDVKSGLISYSYLQQIPTKEQYGIFKDVYNYINQTHNAKI